MRFTGKDVFTPPKSYAQIDLHHFTMWILLVTSLIFLLYLDFCGIQCQPLQSIEATAMFGNVRSFSTFTGKPTGRLRIVCVGGSKLKANLPSHPPALSDFGANITDCICLFHEFVYTKEGAKLITSRMSFYFSDAIRRINIFPILNIVFLFVGGIIFVGGRFITKHSQSVTIVAGILFVMSGTNLRKSPSKIVA